MRVFRIISSGCKVDEFVRECDLEKVLCNCGGKLRKAAKEHSSYGTRESFILVCKECFGSYGATSLMEKEVEELAL